MAAIVKKLNPLAKINYTKLDYDQIIEDIKSIIQSHPKYKLEWQDFLESNAGQMLLETFAYIASKIILRADLIANELFLPTSKDPKSIINLFKLIGYNLKPPTASVVNVIVENTSGTPVFLDIPAGQQISAIDLSGKPITFELMNEENDYDTPLKMENVSAAIFKAFSGRKVEEVISVNKKENFSYTLSSYPVIDGSIKVYLKISDTEEAELEQITSLVTAGEDTEHPRYILSYDHNFAATIQFGKRNFGGAFEDVIDGVEETYQTLRIVYRVGGGANSNITIGAIDTTLRIEGYNLKFYNIEGAIGGTDGETIEDAKRFAPLTTKTVNKTVTPEDYITLLRQQNSVRIWQATIDSPYEHPDRVPYLFNYIYILPQRTWDNFFIETGDEGIETRSEKIPLLDEGESIESYKKRFEIRLNNFLNLKGMAKKVEIENTGEIGYTNEKELKYPDEYIEPSEAYFLYSYLKDKKVTGIENVFRVAKFTPFRIKGILYYKPGFNAVELKNKIIEKLREEYAIEKRDFGESVKISKLYGLIHSFKEVAYFKMIYPTFDILADVNQIYFLLPKSIVAFLPSEIQPEYDIIINLMKE